jgi:glycosyltransferase involved in cell wall biosynthesis
VTPRKVLLVLGQSAGGIARHVAQVTEMLDGTDGLQVDIAGPRDLPVALPKEPIEVAIPRGPIAGHRRAVGRLREIVRQGGYDIVHSHGLRAGIDSGLATRSARVPVFSTVHNLVRPEIAGRLKAPLYRRSESLSVRLTGRTFAVSEEIAGHLRRLIPSQAEKIELLHLGIGDAPHVGRTRAEVRAELAIEGTQPLVVSVARLSAQKALDVLIRAVGAASTGPRLAIVGEGPLREPLEALAAEVAAGRVGFLGWRDDAADFVAAADAFALSSVWEGVPLAAQEAILLGTPVIATAVGGMSELVVDGESGRLVAAGDHAALAAAIDDVLGSPQVAQARASIARADLAVNFSTSAMIARLRVAYLETVSVA